MSSSSLTFPPLLFFPPKTVESRISDCDLPCEMFESFFYSGVPYLLGKSRGCSFDFSFSSLVNGLFLFRGHFLSPFPSKGNDHHWKLSPRLQRMKFFLFFLPFPPIPRLTFLGGVLSSPPSPFPMGLFCLTLAPLQSTHLTYSTYSTKVG